MSRARHKKSHKSMGGEVYSGKGSNVIKEAEEKKRGGRVGKHVDRPEGKKPKMRMDKKPRKKASGGEVDGTPLPSNPFEEVTTKKIKVPKKPAQVPPNEYKRGGRVGSDKNPFSSAASPKQNTEA